MPTVKSLLPEFIVIGAVKAATTWIQAQLQANPAIYMPDPEPHFFNLYYDRGLEFYAQYFEDAGPDKLIGEKSADYLAHEEAPHRIAQILPDIPFVLQLRDPVERAYSDYKMLYRRGTITGPPEDFLVTPDCDQPRCLLDGLYGHHLSRWMDYFDADQFHILLFEDVKTKPRETVEAVCRHIGAPEYFSEDLERKKVNNGSEKYLPLSLRRVLAPFKKSVAPFRGNSYFENMRDVFAKQVDYPPLSKDLWARLNDFYADDIEKLRSLTGHDLSQWTRAEKQAV